MDVNEVVDQLKELSDAKYLAGMARFGITNNTALGIRIPEVRKLARMIKKDHKLALELWETKIHEAHILASMIDDPKWVTESQIDKWTHDFYSWDVCDQVCGNLFDRTPFAVPKAIEFITAESEFVKRAGFVLMAEYAVHQKKAGNEVFEHFLGLIEKNAGDERNFVKKAANWALRQIGKRNAALHEKAVKTAHNILKQDTKASKWIAANALAELESNAVTYRLSKKNG